MHCSSCGTQVSQSTRFCPACGSGINQASQSAPPPSNLLGFSPRINDPAFAQYVKNTNRYAAIFSFILAVAAVIGFYIAGEVGSEMDNPGSLFIGLAIGGMFVVIALFQIRSSKRSTTWDGTVEDKTVKKKTHEDEHSSETYLEYSVIIRSDHGKRYFIRVKNDDTLYNYYRVGDRVRHHAGLKTYEKYDKTGDQSIPCNACQGWNDIRAEYCFRCKCPLLK